MEDRKLKDKMNATRSFFVNITRRPIIFNLLEYKKEKEYAGKYPTVRGS
jgi:hypothetical protein